MKVMRWTTDYSTQPKGITFHNRAFTEPVPFSLTLPPVGSGIYVILAPHPASKPRPYRAIYFGETNDFSARVTESHERFGDWVREAGCIANTYVAFCATPFLRGEQRRWAENDLIVRYRPVCNLKDNITPSFYHPLLSIAK